MITGVRVVAGIASAFGHWGVLGYRTLRIHEARVAAETEAGRILGEHELRRVRVGIVTLRARFGDGAVNVSLVAHSGLLLVTQEAEPFRRRHQLLRMR
jgi:hypothetical protein